MIHHLYLFFYHFVLQTQYFVLPSHVILGIIQLSFNLFFNGFTSLGYRCFTVFIKVSLLVRIGLVHVLYVYLNVKI